MPCTLDPDSILCSVRILRAGRPTRTIGTWVITTNWQTVRVSQINARRLDLDVVDVRLKGDRHSTPKAVEHVIKTACAVVRRCDLGRDRPAGSWDKARRWWPTDEERCPGCATVYTPSRAYPYGLYRHAYTAKHVARREGLGVPDIGPVRKVLRAAVNQRDQS